MTVRRTGNMISSLGAVCRLTELTDQLINLNISSELLESTSLNSPRRIDGTLTEIKIPDGLIENIYALYFYDVKTASWIKITDYKQINNKIILNKVYHGVLLAFPFDAFRDSYYNDGIYTYDMFLTRVDGRVYRNITISTASYLPSPFIELSFSFNQDGPWFPSISSPFLFDIFYMCVKVSKMDTISITHVIPSELITLTCLSCE